MNNAKIQLTLDPSCVTVSSICIKCLQRSFIFLYFYPIFCRLPLLKHSAWRLGILRSLKHAIGKRKSEIHELEYAIWQFGAMQIEKPVKFNTPPRSNFHLNLHLLIHFKSELLKRRMNSIFHERIYQSVNEVNAWTGLTVILYWLPDHDHAGDGPGPQFEPNTYNYSPTECLH